MKCTPSTQLVNYPPGLESREALAIDREFLIYTGWIVPAFASLICSALLGFIGFISLTVLSTIALFACGVTTAIGINRMIYGCVVIELKDDAD